MNINSANQFHKPQGRHTAMLVTFLITSQHVEGPASVFNTNDIFQVLTGSAEDGPFCLQIKVPARSFLCAHEIRRGAPSSSSSSSLSSKRIPRASPAPRPGRVPQTTRTGAGLLQPLQGGSESDAQEKTAVLITAMNRHPVSHPLCLPIA